MKYRYIVVTLLALSLAYAHALGRGRFNPRLHYQNSQHQVQVLLSTKEYTFRVNEQGWIRMDHNRKQTLMLLAGMQRKEGTTPEAIKDLVTRNAEGLVSQVLKSISSRKDPTCPERFGTFEAGAFCYAFVEGRRDTSAKADTGLAVAFMGALKDRVVLGVIVTMERKKPEAVLIRIMRSLRIK